MSIGDNISRLQASIPAGVELIAVSKFHPAEALLEAYAAGQRSFGESRVLELEQKARELPEDIRWHFIGHLQTNKVRRLMPHVYLIHSIDSVRLLRLVNDEALRIGRRVRVLIQLHVALEETKFGFSPDEALETITPQLLAELQGVEVVGVMGMASNVDDDTPRILADFHAIADTFKRLKSTTFADSPSFAVISMGMSHDWPLAVEEGANMIRVGTAIFGEREY